MIINHGGGSANLIEGNFIEGRYREDSYFASGHWNTVVRNRIEQQQGKSDQLHTYDIERGHHYNTAVGNVLGTLGHETNYEQAGSGSAPAIYRLGYDSPWGSYVDSQVIATMLRHGNWDSVNNGVVWDPGISDHNIPASFYLSSIPEWWCSETPWPPIGPDVAGYTNDIPAKRRYEGSICTMGSTSPECSDGDDNDGDGQIDYPTDAGCINANDDDESNCGDTACEGGETCLTCSQDCDSDSDGDSYNSELCGGNDCNDNNPNINQRATEVCSGGADDDCDGQIDCNDIDCSSLPSCQAPPICQDLDLLMHFDVDSSAAVDDSGNGNDATCSGASCPVFGSGRPGFGGAFDYDGTDDQFDLSTFTLGSEFTYSVWIRPDATTSWTTIMAEPGPSGNPIRWLGLLDMQVNWYDNSNNLFGSALSPGSWYYLALSYDGSDVIVYLNGAQIGSPYTPSPYTSVTDSFVIGNNFIGTQAFDGIIDEVAIWNRALSSQEISDIYNSGQPITCLTQYHRADNNPQNGCIRENELTAFITLWKQDSTTYPMREMM
ncbi:MAG: hypothetical protein KAJ19_11180, partial [Gammaproteobacteria bacterium]|nr:hypothetical protein [Gammaproteobacteria bacterium]